MKNYIDTHQEKIIDTPGGKLCQVIGKDNKASCSVALVNMDAKSKGIKHFHDNITEIYIFTIGDGSIFINENENIINDGDCFIIPPNTSHYIETKTNMSFLCICTPPWEEQHEFEINEIHTGKNILKNNSEGILQILGNDTDHNIKRIKITDKFTPNYNMKKYSRIYYIINGNGIIKNNEEVVNIGPNDCLKFDLENETVVANKELEFILICDKIV